MAQSKTREIHRRLSINTASNVGRYVITTGVTFVLTPFIVRTLGDSLYGFWALLTSFIGYASILEMGVQPAVVKLVGQYRAVGDTKKLSELITAAFVFFLVVGAVAAILAVTVLPTVIQNHVEDLRTLPYGSLLFLLIALDAMVMYMNFLVSGVLYGSQKYHVKNLIDVSAWLLNAGLLVLFLERWGVLTMIGAKLTMDVVVAISASLSVRWIAPEIRLNLSLLDRKSFGQLMGFGGRVFVSATTTRMAVNAPPLIISTAISSAATAFYAIPVRLVSYARQISYTLTASFMPMFSELDSQGDRETLRRIYLDYSRLILMILMPFFVGLFVYGEPFIAVWIGPDYAQRGSAVLLLITATALVDNAQPLLWRFFIGIGELNVLIKISAIMSVLSIVASVALVSPMGITGVALGVFAGAFVGKSMLAVYSCQHLDISITALLREVHVPPLLTGAVMFGVALLVSYVLGADGYLRIFGGGAVSAVFYALIAYRFVLGVKERRELRGIFLRRLGRRAAAAELGSR